MQHKMGSVIRIWCHRLDFGMKLLDLSNLSVRKGSRYKGLSAKMAVYLCQLRTLLDSTDFIGRKKRQTSKNVTVLTNHLRNTHTHTHSYTDRRTEYRQYG